MAKKKDEISREELYNLLWGTIGSLSVDDLGWWLECKTGGKYATVDRQFIIEAFDALESCRANIEDINSQFKASWSESLATLRRRPYDPEQKNEPKISLGEVRTYTAIFDDYGVDETGKNISIDLVNVRDEEGRKIRPRLSLMIKEMLDWPEDIKPGKQVSFTAQILEYDGMQDRFFMANIVFWQESMNKQPR